MRALWLAIVIMIMAAAVAVFSALETGNELEVHFLDVGQGDAVLIRTPGRTHILIDGGPDRQVMSELDRILPWWDRRIDLMILTHPHDDHVSGLTSVLSDYRVGKILYSGITHTSPAYLAWLRTIKDKGIRMAIVNSPQLLHLDSGITLEFIWPLVDLSGQIASDLNNSSLVARLAYHDVAFLFTGDIEKEVEADLIRAGASLSAQVLKASHHGSDTSNTEEFVKQVDPRFAVISSGKNNSFGHPSLRVLRRFQRHDIDILRTDVHGTCTFFSDGYRLWRQP